MREVNSPAQSTSWGVTAPSGTGGRRRPALPAGPVATAAVRGPTSWSAAQQQPLLPRAAAHQVSALLPPVLRSKWTRWRRPGGLLLRCWAPWPQGPGRRPGPTRSGRSAGSGAGVGRHRVGAGPGRSLAAAHPAARPAQAPPVGFCGSGPAGGLAAPGRAGRRAVVVRPDSVETRLFAALPAAAKVEAVDIGPGSRPQDWLRLLEELTDRWADDRHPK